jgi:hypothetical protein
MLPTVLSLTGDAVTIARSQPNLPIIPSTLPVVIITGTPTNVNVGQTYDNTTRFLPKVRIY